LESWELIGKKLSGELSPAELLRFEEWLASSPANQKKWEEAEQIWLSSGAIDYGYEPDIEKALTKCKSSLPVHKLTFGKKFFTPLRIAASVLFLIIPVSLVIYLTGSAKPVLPVHEQVVVQAPETPQVKMLGVATTDSAVTFYLPDSTRIFLNKNSSLTYPETFDGLTRTVILTGEAFFQVKRNEQKPFIIEAGNTETKVLGTSFNIKEDAKNKKVEVSVVTGKVQFKAKKNNENLSDVVLLPQDRVVYSETNATMVRQKVKGTDSYWWQKNLKNVRKLFNDAKKGLIKSRKKN
jgi:transmembrane sensor